MMMGPEPMTMTFLMRGSLGMLLHSFHAVDAADVLQEAVEQELGIPRAAAGFGMELHGEAVPLQVFDAFAGLVVGVDMADPAHAAGQRGAQHGVAVVLAGDEG